MPPKRPPRRSAKAAQEGVQARPVAQQRRSAATAEPDVPCQGRRLAHDATRLVAGAEKRPLPAVGHDQRGGAAGRSAERRCARDAAKQGTTAGQPRRGSARTFCDAARRRHQCRWTTTARTRSSPRGACWPVPRNGSSYIRQKPHEPNSKHEPKRKQSSISAHYLKTNAWEERLTVEYDTTRNRTEGRARSKL